VPGRGRPGLAAAPARARRRPALATRLERATLAAVLAVTALLTALAPPASPIGHPAPAVR